MPRLIDLGDVLAVINTSMLNLEYTDENRAMQKAISMLPTVDAVEVVRCKDCKWFHVHKTAVWCEKEEGLYHPQYDSFCSWGKKKEDG